MSAGASARRRIGAPTVILALLSVLAAACGGASTTTTTVTTTTTTPATTVSPRLARVAACLEGQGVSVPAGARAAQMKRLFAALPLARQQAVFAACSAMLPKKLLAKIEALMAAEVSPGSSTTSTTT